MALKLSTINNSVNSSQLLIAGTLVLSTTYLAWRYWRDEDNGPHVKCDQRPAIPNMVPDSMRCQASDAPDQVLVDNGIPLVSRRPFSLLRPFARRKGLQSLQIATRDIAYDGKYRRLSPGIYQLPPPFDFGIMHHSFRIVRNADASFLYDTVTNALHPWPVAAEFVSATQCCQHMSYEPSTRTLTVGHPADQLSVGVGLVPYINEFSCPSNPDITMLTWLINNTRYLKIANAVGYVSLPEGDYQQIYARFHSSSVVAPNSISSKLRNCGNALPEDVDTITNTLHMVLGGGDKGSRKFNSFVRDLIIADEQEETVPTEDRSTITACGPAIITSPGVAPARSTGNDADAIQSRLYDVNPINIELPRDIIEYFGELASIIKELTLEHNQVLLSPLTYNEVIDEQRTAKTRKRITVAAETEIDVEGDVPIVQAFVKTELYNAPKKCRNISNMAAVHNLHGFAFDIPFKRGVLKHIPAYCPGLTPEEIVEKIEKQLNVQTLPPGFKHGNLHATDFSNMDGTETEVLRRQVFRLYAAAFQPEHQDKFGKLIDNHFDSKCFFASEHKYQHFGSMFSGSFCTTNGNTLLTISMMYCALRRLGLSPKAAMYHLGLAFGDDGAWRNITCEKTGEDLRQHILGVAKDYGMKIEVEDCDTVDGITYVNFLSRWYGLRDGSVYCSSVDLARQLPKFQTITRRDATDQDFAEKFSSLWLLTGRHTPVISPYIRKWFELNKKEMQINVADMDPDNLPYLLREVASDLVFNMQGLFPLPTTEINEYALRKAAESLGCEPEDLGKLHVFISESRTLEELNSHFVDRDVPAIPDNYLLVGDELRKSIRSKLTVPAEKIRHPNPKGKGAGLPQGARQPRSDSCEKQSASIKDIAAQPRFYW